MTAPSNWLEGRRALIAGAGAAADAVATGFAAAGAKVERVSAVAVDGPDIAEVFATTEAKLGGPVDLLVHAGAELADASAEMISLEAWRSGFSADIDGRFLHAAEFARRSIAAKQRGAILFLMPSPKPGPGRATAASANGALDNLVKSLSVEWGRDGIRTNAITSRVVEGFATASPEGRTSLVNLGAYICSDYGAYITGCLMGVDEL